MASKKEFMRAASKAFTQAKKNNALGEGVDAVGFRPGIIEAEDRRFEGEDWVRMVFKGIYKKKSYYIFVDWNERKNFTVAIGPYDYDITLTRKDEDAKTR